MKMLADTLPQTPPAVKDEAYMHEAVLSKLQKQDIIQSRKMQSDVLLLAGQIRT